MSKQKRREFFGVDNVASGEQLYSSAKVEFKKKHKKGGYCENSLMQYE